MSRSPPATRLALIPLLLALAWGLNWPAVKIILSAVPPFTLRWLGLGSGALLLAGVAALRGAPLRPAPGAWPGILAGGALTIAAFNVCTAFAQLSTSTSRAAVLTYTMPMIAAALAWLLLGERPGRRGGFALLLGATGIAVLAGPVLQAPSLEWRGLALPLLAAGAWATGTIATKRWPPAGDRLVVTAWQLAIGAACAGIAAGIAGESVPTVWGPRVVAALGYHIVIATAVAYVLWYRLLESHSATVSSLTTLAVPVVGVIGAMALVGDRPGVADWIGFALVLGGATLVVLPLGRQR